jgi:peroxiredoxin
MNSLKAEISKVRAASEQSLPESVRKVMQRSVQRLVESGMLDNAVGVGDMFPHFSLPNAGGDAVSSEEYLARGPLVVCFYRGGWCPYCNLELRAYQAILDDIRALGADFIAISPQLPDESLTMAAKASLTYEVLSDTGNSLAEHLGLVHELAPAVVDLYRSWGYDLERINGMMRWTLPIPATYVINTDGVVAEAFINPDYTVRLEPAEVLKVLESLQAGRL